ncbi:MAG: hypothetical protein MZV63_65915 [Marinilabiliales bacterium]|nr:hypothetical protein [Marinilabiliales bacterium]
MVVSPTSTAPCSTTGPIPSRPARPALEALPRSRDPPGLLHEQDPPRDRALAPDARQRPPVHRRERRGRLRPRGLFRDRGPLRRAGRRLRRPGVRPALRRRSAGRLQEIRASTGLPARLRRHDGRRDRRPLRLSPGRKPPWRPCGNTTSPSSERR